MTKRIDINADMGESYGRWVLGNDAALMPYLTSANIACGFHGSDPLVMRTTVRLARDNGVAIGAHVGLPDLLGFGRRRMEITPQELRDYVVYQVGALRGFAAAEGARVEHVKPHGALYNMCTTDEEYAAAVVEAVRELGDDLILVLVGSRAEAAAAARGVRFAREGYIDLDYNADGTIILERAKKPGVPDVVASRAVTLATQSKVPVRAGGWLPLEVRSMCIHGDAPNAPEVAQAVGAALRAANVQPVSLRQLFDA